MGFFDWLLGKPKPSETTTPAPTPGALAPAAPPATPAASAPRVPTGNGAPTPPRSPEDNLKRWRESGQPQKWVAARHGHWNHDDWVALLDSLQKSEFWPLNAEAIGRTLEELKKGQKVANGQAAH